ncbi:MAG: response regulator [Bacteroidota bacterium]
MSKPFIICIVDDDKIYQYTTSKMIEANNIAKRIMVFSDGEEAMNFMTDNIANNTDLPDVIFLDVNMPIMDGWQFLEKYVDLKPRIGKKITLFMISSSNDPDDVERSKRISEISDYIIKPVTAQQFKEIIEELAEQHS